MNKNMFWENLRKKIFENLTWILLLFSLVLIIFSLLNISKNSQINEVLFKIAYAMLTSGIFTAILKSLQFTGIFKEEITKVMTSKSFLENRNDLPILWKDISKSLYNRKFPKIGTLLEDKILENYFPTNSKFYYEDYTVSINITEINDNFEISYTQICDYSVILDNIADSVILEIESKISDDDDPNSSIKNELDYFLVNGVNVEMKEDVSTIKDAKKTLYKHELSGAKVFKIKSKYSRKYPLKNENFKLFRMKYITYGMYVSVKFPENVRVSFFSIGLVKGFSNINEDFTQHICRILRNDIILPHQGFGLSFEKISDK